MVSPDSLGTECPLSGRSSTYLPVQILEAGSTLPRYTTQRLEKQLREAVMLIVLG